MASMIKVSFLALFAVLAVTMARDLKDTEYQPTGLEEYSSDVEPVDSEFGSESKTELLSGSVDEVDGPQKSARACFWCGGRSWQSCRSYCKTFKYRCWRCNPCACNCSNNIC